MRSTTSTDYDREKEIEKFSGDEPNAAMKFLEHDINGQDNAEANYGVIGVAIHRGTDPVVTAANLNAEATKLHRFINIAEGSKAGTAPDRTGLGQPLQLARTMVRSGPCRPLVGGGLAG